MTKLSDTQAILLSTAAQRDTLSILPLPTTVKASGANKAIAALIRRGFALERQTPTAETVHRVDGEVRYGVFATTAGLTALGIEPDSEAAASVAPALPAPPTQRSTKAQAVLALLQRSTGATLPELIDATGWLPHTTRAALTGLRKKGHTIERSKRDDATCYRVIA